MNFATCSEEFLALFVAAIAFVEVVRVVSARQTFSKRPTGGPSRQAHGCSGGIDRQAGCLEVIGRLPAEPPSAGSGCRLGHDVAQPGGPGQSPLPSRSLTALWRGL